MKVVCRSCGSDDVVLKDGKYQCLCCGDVFDVKPNVDNSSEPLSQAQPINKLEKLFKQVISINALFDNTVKAGTAFFISSTHALTNAHVVLDGSCTSFSVTGKNYESTKAYELEVVAYETKLDVAVLKMKDDTAKFYSRFSENLSNGQAVYAIGNSKGQGLCIVNGIVSDKNRYLNDIPYIMCSALVTNGNSGGPLYDDKGCVIGMITCKDADTVAMNYALPAKLINEYLRNKGIDIK